MLHFVSVILFCQQSWRLMMKRAIFLSKLKGMMHEVVYASHPFDVVGWDGYNFPYGFSIHNFEPITGRVHQPPPGASNI
jgi:homogentisate 1,2-dioxygenase